MRRVSLALLPIVLGAGGCTLVLDPGEQQCQAASDCSARGFKAAVCMSGVCVTDPVWGCLGHVTEPNPDPTQKVTITEQLTHTDQSPITMATVDVCSKLDVDCTTIDPDYPKGLSPDGNGNVTFQVIQGFDGFVRIAGPGLMDSRVFVGRPIITPPAVKSVRVLQVSEYSDLAGFAGQMVDTSHGTSILYAVDCSGLAAGGVSFSTTNTDSESKQFYLINQLPTIPPSATATDKDGFGGYFNMPPGPAVANATRAEGNTPIGQSSFAVLQNTVSYVQIAPTPM